MIAPFEQPPKFIKVFPDDVIINNEGEATYKSYRYYLLENKDPRPWRGWVRSNKISRTNITLSTNYFLNQINKSYNILKFYNPWQLQIILDKIEIRSISLTQIKLNEISLDYKLDFSALRFCYPYVLATTFDDFSMTYTIDEFNKLIIKNYNIIYNIRFSLGKRTITFIISHD